MLALSSVWRIVCDAWGVTKGDMGFVCLGEFSLGCSAVVVQRPLAGFTLADPLPQSSSSTTLRLSSRTLFLILRQYDASEVLSNVCGKVD